MSVDVTDFVDNLKREVNPPGTDLFPDAIDADWAGRLQDAFWECRLLGLLAGFTEDEDGIITPLTGDTDIGRDSIQLIVFVAGLSAIRSQMTSLKSTKRYKAGPVEAETQQSAQLLQVLFKDLQRRLELILSRLSDLGTAPTFVLDGVIERIHSWDQGDTWWLRG